MNTDQERELPMLAGIAGFLRWCEELLNILNGPILLFGAGVALVDLLTDGALTVTIPALLFAWAISQALGIDTQLLGAFVRASRARGWSLVGWLALGGILGFAAWQAGDVFAIQQAQHISESAALAQLHMDPALWLGWRAFLAVGLVALSGWTRYRKPARVAISLDEERAALERELMLTPMRQQLLAQRVGGFRAIAQTALQGAGGAQNALVASAAIAPHLDTVSPLTATPEGQQTALREGAVSSDLPTRPPTGPGSPLLGSNPRKATSKGAAANVTRLPAPRAPRQSRRTAAQANARSGKRGTAEARIRAILAQEPSISFDELVTRAKVSRSTASKYVALVESERANVTPEGGQYAQ